MATPAARSALRCDIDLHAEGKDQGFVRLAHSSQRSAYGRVQLPVMRIRRGDGPRVLVLAGNHGDEWEGPIALARLMRELEPEQVRGTLVALPAVNLPAVLAASRCSPIDGGNLNRSFPGDPQGGVTAQIAWWLEHELLGGFDLSVDLHSGGSSLVYLPCVLAYREADPARMARVLDLVRAFGAPAGYIVHAPQSGGRSFTAASQRQGVLSIATEVGGGGQVSPATLSLMEGGLRRLLAHVGLLQGPVPPAPGPTRLTQVLGDDHHVHATERGLFEPLVDVGAEVRAGQPAARIHHPDTPWRAPEALSFGASGLVLCKRALTDCERGDCLFQVGSDLPAAG